MLLSEGLHRAGQDWLSLTVAATLTVEMLDRSIGFQEFGDRLHMGLNADAELIKDPNTVNRTHMVWEPERLREACGEKNQQRA